MASIFTKIIEGELPCYKIAETERTISFLTIAPIHPGHTLVVPKKEVDHWLDVPQEDYLEAWSEAQRIGKAIHKATGSDRVGVMLQGFEVRHCHIHLIPAWGPQDFDFRNAKELKPQEMEAVAQKIRSLL